MDDYGAVQDIPYTETFVIESPPGIPLIAQKRQKIPGMLRMGLHSWIVVFSGFGKVIRTVTILVDVHGVEIGRTLGGNIGQSKDFGFYQNTSIGSIVKFYKSAYLRGGGTTLDPGDCLRAVILKQLDERKARSWRLICLLHHC